MLDLQKLIDKAIRSILDCYIGSLMDDTTIAALTNDIQYIWRTLDMNVSVTSIEYDQNTLNLQTDPPYYTLRPKISSDAIHTIMMLDVIIEDHEIIILPSSIMFRGQKIIYMQR